MLGILAVLHTAAWLWHSKPLFVLTDTLALAPAAPDRAVLYLAREEVVREDRALPPERVYLDGVPLGLLPQRSYLTTSVPPGTHCLTGIHESTDLCLELRPGRVYFLRLREVIDEADQVAMEWLFESPDLLPQALGQGGIQLATLTPRGRARLAKRAALESRPEWEAEHRKSAAVTLPLVLEEIWQEDKMDPLNLKHDFQRSRMGTLTIGTDSLRFVSKRRSLAIPGERIARVRFGGTRFTATTPWVHIDYLSESGPRACWFADSRASLGTETYNRIFLALQSLRNSHPPPAPDSTAPGTDR